MTFDECHAHLAEIRRRQGTSTPLIRVDCGGKRFLGRLARTDTDPDRRRDPSSPYGILVLENPGLIRAPETILQIAEIADDGLHDVEMA